MPRKNAEEVVEEVIEGEVVEEKWSIPRIVLAIFMVIFLSYFSFVFFGDVATKIHQKAAQVLAQSVHVSKESVPQEGRLPTQHDVETILQDVQENVMRTAVDNFQSSHSAIFKVVNEFQQLRSGKRSVTQVFCDLACK